MPFIEFEEFKDNCLEDLSGLQEEFKKLYNLDDYEEWYYDHGIGVFEFKSENKHLYFRYIDVGSFSNNTKTWKWSWDNEHTPASVKKGIEKVKAFGEENSLAPLTTGLIEGDEYTGWKMTAIANKVLNGIGVYKAPADHLDIFFVFVCELEQDQYDDLKKKYVKCGEHGSRRRAFVCQHLNKRKITGFHEAFPSDPDDELEEDDFQAWCNKCEKERLKEGEWNDASMAFANIKLICNVCYFEIKERNLGHKNG